MLDVPGLITSQWAKDLEGQGVLPERMWTVEMVSFAHYFSLTTLYPPTTHPFSVHCATDHGADKGVSACGAANLSHVGAADLYEWSATRLTSLGWDAICHSNCEEEQPGGTQRSVFA